MEDFDTIIVGAGPTGLTCAWYAAKKGENVLVVDRADQIGGCHRVNRELSKDGTILFGEHGPRIYSTSYVCFRKLLSEMKIDFDELFTPYEFGVGTIGKMNASKLTFRELSFMVVEFVFGGHGNLSVQEFGEMKKFSPATMDYLDRLCRLTDGAGADRYRMDQFLNLINQQSMYSLMQPKIANDRGLFKLWRQRLEDTGKVKFWLNTDVTALVVDDVERKVRGVIVDKTDTPIDDMIRINSSRVIFCVPPLALQKILGGRLLRKYFDVDKEWVRETTYDQYINVTFMWHENVLENVSRVWGFPASEWGVAFIVLTDTMQGENFNTIISSAITKIEMVPPKIGRKKIVEEVFRQVKLSYPNLPMYDEVTVDMGKDDYAFVDAVGTRAMDVRSYVRGLFSVGPHNKKSEYTFTSLEAAVSNAMHFYGISRPQLWTLRKTLIVLLAVIIGVMIGKSAGTKKLTA